MMRFAAIIALCFLLVACGGFPRGGDSPGTAGGAATAVQGQGAQTVGGDQGQAETPQTNTTGTATNMFKFASEGVSSSIGEQLIGIAEQKAWTPEQLASVLKSMNGAPENVTITITGNITAETGAAENVGSAGGTGGSSSQAGNNPRND